MKFNKLFESYLSEETAFSTEMEEWMDSNYMASALKQLAIKKGVFADEEMERQFLNGLQNVIQYIEKNKGITK